MAGEVYYIPGDQDPARDGLFEAVRGKIDIGVGKAAAAPPECVALVLGPNVDPRPAFQRVKALRFVQLTTCDNPFVNALELDERMVRVASIAPAVAAGIARHTVGLAAAATRLPRMAGRRSREEITALAKVAMTSSDFADKQVGLVGLGTVGHAVARRLGSSGARLVYADLRTVNRHVTEGLGIRRLTIDLLLTQSDVVIVTARWGPTANPVIGQRELRLPDPGAVLVNSADSRLVDEPALHAALSSGQLRGAALGVAADRRLGELPNVISCDLELDATHSAAAAELVASNLERFANDEPVAGLMEPIDFPAAGDPAFWSSRLYPHRVM